MSETPELPALVSFCGRPGQLEPVSEASVGADGCWVWRTDGELLKDPGASVNSSLLNLACDVAELYHQRHVLNLSDVPGAALEVIWLELAADNSLLVFLKSVAHTNYA